MTTDRHPDNHVLGESTPDGAEISGTQQDSHQYPITPETPTPPVSPPPPTAVGTHPYGQQPGTWGPAHGSGGGFTSPLSGPYATGHHPAAGYPPAGQYAAEPYPDGPATPPPGPAGPLATRRPSMKPIIATALIAGLIGGAVALGGNALVDHTTATVPQLAAPPATTAADVHPGSVTYAAQAASKFTADIEVAGAQGTAVGSGIVLSPDGYVLTNNHVVSGVGNTSAIQVTTTDQKTYRASVVGTSPSYDLAVIKLQNAAGLTPASLGNSDGLQVGQQVVAVGSPESLSNTVTSGIISNLSRTVTAGDEQGSAVAVYNGLQTDTPINPGNSGGPLVNLSGQVIGVNSAVDTGQASQGGVQAYGLGFAIPINTARRVANELLADGHATKPVLGVTGSLSESGTSGVEGAQITNVSGDGAAAAAGIKPGDMITKVGDQRVTNYADLMAQILTHEPGSTVPITVSSGGQEHTVTVKLGSAVDNTQTTVPSNGNGNGGTGGLPFP
ncbi:trypsin-like peptidase domain-containing protein [Gordonia sp. L191]|uniref:S1C family serine protease n=1 Tax=Gordonia sp. L191 TaxID=2982699 RepID=UPI0024C093F8|nr:trypsin-like peptidase domain-containing protein [Gordonia sp. L191]WHU48695.1 trypsin-like peptidase domain-containing protein [Gordonia sp. L191]